MAAPEELVRVGRVVKPHGIRGEVVVEPEGETLGLLPSPAVVFVGDPPAERTLQAMRPHAGRLLVTVEGIDDRAGADALRGSWLRVSADALPEADADAAYVDDLVGCRLEDADGATVGTVRGVLPGAAHDLLEVEAGAGTVLVPMVREWLLRLDADGGVIRMRLPEGLIGD